MSYIDKIKAKAKANKKTIILPETEDTRTLRAAEDILLHGYADIILLAVVYCNMVLLLKYTLHQFLLLILHIQQHLP